MASILQLSALALNLLFLLPNILTWNHICPDICSCRVAEWKDLHKVMKTAWCVNASLLGIPDLPLDIEAVVLRCNGIGYAHHFSILNLLHLKKVMLFDLSFNRIRSFRHTGGMLPEVNFLNLSHNYLSKLHAGMFRSFPNTEHLFLRHNRISFIAPLSLELPRLKNLDMTGNRLNAIQPHYFESFKNLQVLLLSYNHIGRIADNIFPRATSLDILDLEGNKITKIEDKAFMRVSKISVLNLAKNYLHQSPCMALSSISSLSTLILSKNSFRTLQYEAIKNVNVTSLKFDGNSYLFTTESRAFSDLPYLTKLSLYSNRNLTFLDPETFHQLPNLRFLDLRDNNLLLLEGVMFRALSTLSQLYLSGNPFWCSCNMRWLQDKSYASVVSDLSNVTCANSTKVYPLSGLSELPSVCPPKIFPLYENTLTSLVGRDLSARCAATGIPRPEIQWNFPDKMHLKHSLCYSKRCVKNGVLTLRYARFEDNGDYVCIASNSLGNDSKGFTLDVQKLNIHMRVVTVASNFVTLSWNTSASSMTNDYVLQYKETTESKVFSRPLSLGLKVHFYTVNGLHPGKTYRMWLCLQRDNFVIRLSSLDVTTKKEDFLLMLGIHTNYVGVVLLTLALGTLVVGFLAACGLRIYRWRYKQHHEMLLSDNSYQICCNDNMSFSSDLTYMTYVSLAEENVLVDNDEDAA